ncbi:MAG TPA: Tm-1-like ATP-binding domain-containing protein [Syntrophorhabdaceae bacterium]|nr:Tm-1-like ATP-binding domain-containing protein [Syntrophorhabdaceae bacterium]
MDRMKSVLIIATMDTKYKEARYIESCLKEIGIPFITLDGGIKGDSPFPVQIKRGDVAIRGGMSIEEVRNIGHEGEAISIMARGAREIALELYKKGEIGGIIGIGGSMGTTLCTHVMQAFPIGFPKVMITTMASRDTRSFVRTKDIAMFYSISDISGINRITEKILRNGALAIAGMVKDYKDFPESVKPLIILSTLGTTEGCAQYIKNALEERGREVIVFHTNGSGGEAMEELISNESVEAVVDLSLHELVDHYFGGDYDAGPERGSIALKKGIPTILIPGNTDFIVTGPLEKAKKYFPGREYHSHNAAITTLRTKKRELEFIAEVIAKFCNEAKGSVYIMIPGGGFSVWDQKGHPFYDPDGVKVFTKVLKKELKSEIPLTVSPYNANDIEFAKEVVEKLVHHLKLEG